MKQSLIFCVLLTLNCCTNQDLQLTGKKIYFDWNINSLNIVLPDTSIIIGLPRGEGVDYNSPIWLKNEDKFLINISSKSIENNCYNHCIGLYNLYGEFEDTIYVEKPCLIIDYMPSPNDSLLLIRRYDYQDWKKSKPTDTIWFEHNLDYLIFNINKSTIQSCFSIQSGLFLDRFYETMWSKDSKRVLISKKPEQSVNNRKPSKWYVYDLNTRDTTFIDVGINFIWSPSQDHLIAFAKDNSLFFHFLDSNTTEQFYQLPKTHKIKSFQWTPDGKELLIHCIKSSFLLKPLGSKVACSPYDILINVNDKKIKKQSRNEIIDSWK